MNLDLSQEMIKIIAVLTVAKYLLSHVDGKIAWADDVVIVIVGVGLSYLVKYQPDLYEVFYDGLVAVGVVMLGVNYLNGAPTLPTKNSSNGGTGTDGK